MRKLMLAVAMLLSVLGVATAAAPANATAPNSVFHRQINSTCFWNFEYGNDANGHPYAQVQLDSATSSAANCWIGGFSVTDSAFNQASDPGPGWGATTSTWYRVTLTTSTNSALQGTYAYAWATPTCSQLVAGKTAYAIAQLTADNNDGKTNGNIAFGPYC